MCCVWCDADIESSVAHSERVHPAAHVTQNASEIEHYDQPTEGDDGKTCDQMKTDQELRKGDQSEEHDGERGGQDAVSLEHQQGAVLDQEESRDQVKITSDSSQSDTEQVETFFNTMTHRYENAAL